MAKEESIGRRIGKTLTKRIGTVVLVLGVILIGVSIGGYVWNWGWTGLRGTTEGGPKTLWHWLDLLIIPLVLAAGALWFRRLDEETRRARERADAKTAAFIEEQRVQEAALEAYLDCMSDLLLEKDPGLRGSVPGDPIRNMAQIRTITALRRLDASRRNQVLVFLRDARLLDTPFTSEKRISKATNEDGITEEIALLQGAKMIGIDFSDTDLSGINLERAYLSKSNLSGSNLYSANLSGAKLIEATLSGAKLLTANVSKAFMDKIDLSLADLSMTDIGYSSLSEANLQRSNMNMTNFTGADLSKADFREANMADAYLTDACVEETDFRGVENLTCDQLRLADKWALSYRDNELACGASIPIKPTEQENNE